MQRVTITLDDELLAVLDRIVATRGYQSRSEAIRDLARAGLVQAREATGGSHECVAALVYVYGQEGRDMPRRLAHIFRDHHDLSVATMRVHLDHDSCMEVAVLKGYADEIRHMADHLTSERGVRHGRVVTIPVQFETQKHAHGAHPRRSHLHAHVREGG
jgi:CopG family transcriptional regulator, nickel-responsive regulator